MRFQSWVIVAVAWTILPTQSYARELVLPVDKTRVISDRGDHRVLFTLGERSRLAGKYIEEAHLVLTLPADVTELPDTPIEIQIHGVTRPWTADADWNAGWGRAGGDIDEDVFSRTIVHPRELAGTLRLPVDLVLRESVQGGGLHGMLVTVAPYKARGLRAGQLRILANATTAHVEVKWSPRPPESPRRRQARQ